MVWPVAKRRARKESVSIWTGAPSAFERHFRAHRRCHGNHERWTVAFASLDYWIFDLAWVISLYTYLTWRWTISRIDPSSISEDVTDSGGFPQLVFDQAAHTGLHQEANYPPNCCRLSHLGGASDCANYSTTCLNIGCARPASTFIMAVSIHTFSSTTRVACWISFLPSGPPKSQVRPASTFDFLLFFAIKSHFLFVVLSFNTRASVMLMKGQ